MSKIPVKLTDGSIHEFHVDTLLLEQVFEAIKDGRMTLEQLDEWREFVYESAYEYGFRNGRDS